MTVATSRQFDKTPSYATLERPDGYVSHRSVLERSLRRRLWKALQEEDSAMAMRVYTATKIEYETWLEKEICEEYRVQMLEAVKSEIIDVVSRYFLIDFLHYIVNRSKGSTHFRSRD
jgi:hypothetical protein